MQTGIVIPARRGSTRFPNKPLAMVAGHSVIYRTWRIAKAVPHVDKVVVATDDEAIAEAARAFGAQVVVSHTPCDNGTLRMHDALQHIPTPLDIAINLQADAILTPPWVIAATLQALLKDPTLEVATPATPLDEAQLERLQASKAGGRISGTLVVFNRAYDALYFSKGLIPHVRQRQGAPPYFRHIGLYAYRQAALARYASLPATPLEMAEGLEQLRLLEHGLSIRVVPVDYRGRSHWSIDNPSDVAVAEAIVAHEGELVP